MIHEHPATLIILGCDVPRCTERHEGYRVDDPASRELRFLEWPKDWKQVPLDPSSTPDVVDAEYVALCPTHAHLADTLALVLTMLSRRESNPVA